MRILTILTLSLGFTIGCGGSSSTLTEVGDLSTNSQVDLCNDFVDQICDVGNPDLDGFCGDPCVTDPNTCIEASESLAIDGECDLVLVDEVEDCFITGDLDICDEGGGCMFDAIDSVCVP